MRRTAVLEWPSGTTDPANRTEVIQNLIKDWRDRLGLTEWDIRYDPESKPDKGCIANIGWREMERVAVIRVHKKLPFEQLEASVVHELLHLALKPYVDVAKNSTANLKEPLRGVMADMIKWQLENVIDVICRSYGLNRFSPYGPLLPKWRVFASGQ